MSSATDVADLAGVRWTGGGSGAGKSTVAGVLARRFGLPVVNSDVSLRTHATAMGKVPRVRAFVEASMDERWVLRTPQEMLRTFPWFEGDGFELLLDHVRGLTGSRPVIVEGFRLLPRLIAPLVEEGGHAVWLLPTPAMRLVALRGREVERAFWTRTSDPDRALANVLERDRLFTERVRMEAEELGLTVLEIDDTVPIDAVAACVATVLRLE